MHKRQRVGRPTSEKKKNQHKLTNEVCGVF